MSYKKAWIFAIGGEGLTSVEVYNISLNQWFQAPHLNTDRSDASSCEQDDYIYTFGGLGCRAGYQLADIERLDAKKVSLGTDGIEWEVMQIKDDCVSKPSKRESACMVSYDNDRILILGGDGDPNGF